jgi:hypothetical protein
MDIHTLHSTLIISSSKVMHQDLFTVALIKGEVCGCEYAYHVATLC